MEKLKRIISNAGMSTRPDFYAGRGATTSDLNWKILEKIFVGIIKEYGEEAGEAFLDLVEAMPVMTATAFLGELYSLAGNGWKFTGVAGHSNLDFAKDAEGNYNLAQGMGVLLSAMFSTGRDETEAIKTPFLRMHERYSNPKTRAHWFGREREF